MEHVIRRWALPGAAAALVLATTAPAAAHTDLLRTNPEAESSVTGTVSTVRLEFVDPVIPELTDVVVTGPGASVQVADPTVSGALVDATLERATPPGEYVVAYRTVAQDGHPVTGSFTFEVVPGAASARAGVQRVGEAGVVPVGERSAADAPGRSVEDPEPGGANADTVTWVIAGLAVASVLALALLRRGRQRGVCA
jgi:methionine-rich copper-binding protein CopC